MVVNVKPMGAIVDPEADHGPGQGMFGHHTNIFLSQKV
jgi:hypothetical protein